MKEKRLEKKMTNRMSKRAAALCMGILLALSLTGCGDGKGKEAEGETGGLPEVMKIGYVSVPNDAMIANVENLYEELDFDYELVEFSSGKDVNNALASGSIDIGYLGTVPAATGIASDMGYEVFWIDGIITGCECLAVREGIGTVEELGGKSIGVVTGSTSHYSLISALEYYGVDLSTVTILNGTPAEITAMWDRGDIDAAYVWEPSLSSIVADGGTKIFSGEDGERIGAVTAVVHVVNKEFADQYPEAVSALVDIFAAAQEIYRTDTQKVVADISARLEIDSSLATLQIEGYRWLTKEEQASESYLGGNFAQILKDTADFLAEQSSIPSSPELSVFEAAVTAEFVK